MRCIVGVSTTLLLLQLTCFGDPVITDGLSVYYGFDEVSDDLFLDGSGNNLHGLITFGFDDANGDDLDDIRLDTVDKVVGAGSVRFDTDAEIKEDYIAVCDPANQPEHNDGCGEPLEDRPEYVPINGFTVAAWVKVDELGAENAIWQSRAGGGGFLHTEVRADGNLRMTLRGDANSHSIVDRRNLEIIDSEEWFHYAGTYQKGDDPDEPGDWAFYVNGSEIDGGVADGAAAGFPPDDEIGDWVQGAFIGLVPDMNRQMKGNLDEFYLFNRGLSEEEIQTIFNDSGGDPCDFDGSGAFDAGDIAMIAAAIQAGANDPTFDLTADGAVDQNDLAFFVTDSSKLNTWIGDSNLDGEFNSGDLVGVFQGGKFETAEAATWAQGDWDGNGTFGTGDLVAAFQNGGFEQGPRAGALAAVPEPSSLVLALMAAMSLYGMVRRK